MTGSQKQLEANRKNAKRGGVKTEEGKAIVKFNALKHGLLARETVVTVGDGAENPDEFNSLLEDLTAQFKPEGTLEEMLVEKIAVAYWRLRRACRCEVGLIRNELDRITDDFYGRTILDAKTDEQIDSQIVQERESFESWKKDRNDLAQMHHEGRPLHGIYDRQVNWDWLWENLTDPFPQDEDDGTEDENDGEEWPPQKVRQYLNGQGGWSDDDVWKGLIEVCDQRMEYHQRQIAALEKQREQNKLRLDALRQLSSVPPEGAVDRLLRYEGAIERQFYKALNQLERLQRLRAGDSVPAPVAVDVDVNGGQTT